MPDNPHQGARTAALWSQVVALLERRKAQLGHSALDILDVGGGSGVFAVALASQGHRITVVDPSPNALATLRQRALESGVTDQVEAVQGDAAGLPGLIGAETADVVLCHGVLEVADDPATALAGIASCLRPSAIGSIVTAQRNAAVIGKAVAGHLEEAKHLLEDPDGRWGATDPLPRRFSEAGLGALLASVGFVVDEIHGVRIFTDLVPGTLVDDPADVRALSALEAQAASHPELRPLAGALHAIVSMRRAP
ncbi:methyltransferase domain-containing protein [Phytoactinopolyspora sp. XMNu-373]|uniref:Methyltransferase domain-containing protein n=2 Tax=Phytoactinopolyspora mesophila TaxID=2650750 RepID=A0A7K3M886_9ACTN|nr:methyltransferase domain-containing protein [Phytoactinopolyspora mesophila]